MIANFYSGDFKKAIFNSKFYNFQCLSFRCTSSIDLKTEKQDSISFPYFFAKLIFPKQFCFPKHPLKPPHHKILQYLILKSYNKHLDY